MSSSSRRRQQMQDLEVAEAKELGQAVSDVVNAVVEASETIARAPQAFVRGRLDREWAENEGLREAFNRARDEGERGPLDSMVKHIASRIEQDIDCLHSDGATDDSTFDDNTRAILTYVRDRAELPANFPMRLIADHLESEINSDPDSASIPERAKSQIELEVMLRRAGHSLRTAAHDLITRTRPSTELPWNLAPADLGDLSDKDFEKVKRHMARMTDLANKKRK